MKKYLDKKQLNSPSSPYTGHAMAFRGKNYYYRDKNQVVTILTISDCHGTITLHPEPKLKGANKDFIKKLRILEKLIKDFADFLEAS